MDQWPERGRARSLRQRVRNAIAVVAALSLLLFGIPLAVVINRLIESQALAGLQRDATRAVAGVPDNTLETGVVLDVPPSSANSLVGVYNAGGVRLVGRGPARSGLARQAADGREHDGHESGALSVVVPVLSDTAVAGSVRAAVPLSRLHGRVAQAWALLALLALGVIGVAVLLARRAAGRISAPFEHITAAARALGDGDYAVRLPRWGLPEADAAGEALRESARQIDALVRHEREFMTDASHQLRTPLAGVILSLERQPPDPATALDSARHLQTTISDLLSLHGVASRGSCNPCEVAAAAVRRWTSQARPVTLRSDSTHHVVLTDAALRQCLDVLLDNAIRHGGGPVTVTIEPFGDSVVVEVADHGNGFGTQAQPGTGLGLATRIVERAGGSLVVRRRAPQARVALLLPQAGNQSSSSR